VEGTPITFITIEDPFFANNLARSPLWWNREKLPHQWIILQNEKNEAVSTLYYRAQASAMHDLMVFLHPDVFLPETWYEDFLTKLNLIEALDPDWGVLGTAGVALDWNHVYAQKVTSSITDFIGSYKTGADSIPMQSLDEHCLVLRRGSPMFDPDLPGFDLYGADIVLSARSQGMKAYLLNTPLLHKTVNAQGDAYTPHDFFTRLADATVDARIHNTIDYVQRKWCHSGLLPVYGTAFDVKECS
jgi:hypothetical protein